MTTTDDKRQAAEQRRQAISECRACDDYGWVIGQNRLPVDPARKCRHGEPQFGRWQ